MKKNAFVLVELIVSITFVSIISLILINTVIHMSTLLSETLIYRQETEDKTTIYNLLAVRFSTQNISNIKKIQNGYEISYKEKTDINGTTNYNNTSITLEDGLLYINGQPFESNDNIEYDYLSLNEYKIPTNTEKSYLKLTIGTYVNGDPSDIEIYYLNDMDYTIDTNLAGVNNISES